MVKRMISWLTRRIPESLFAKSEKILTGLKIDYFEIERQRAFLFAEKLQNDFEKTVSEIAKNKRIMVISKGEYSYACFNAAYLSNMLGLMFYALYKGCIPRITVNEGKENCNQWEWYFLQPQDAVWGDVDTSDFKIIQCDKNNWYCPGFSDAFHINDTSFQFWNFMFMKFVILNKRTEQYFEQEWKGLPEGKKLAVLIRGTDYVALKPKGHPRQPNMEELLAEVDRKCSEKKYQYLYIATEEKRLFDLICDHYGENMVLANKRTYYDAYWSNGCQLIGEISFQRENEVFIRGIEYLSSLFIVSRCDGFVGSNCGGTLVALLLAHKHEDTVVINKGFY